MKKYVILIFFLIFFLNWSFGQEKPYVLIVSFDGFRHDYVERFDLPNFKGFINEGSQAEALIPSFPSKTFPNHYAIITGLYPGHNGLVDNQFYDIKRKEFFTMREREKVTDKYYYGGVPLWTLAQQHGMKTASYFWVGSESPTEGDHPDYYYTYDESVPFETRVTKVAEWLKLPEMERPQFITLYFSSPDHESHGFGPLSEEARLAAVRMDSLLGMLMTQIEKIDLPVNTLLVSDHGMKELTFRDETFIFLDEIMDLKNKSIIWSNGGTQTHIYTKSKDQADSLFEVIKAKQKHFTVLRKSQYKEEWNFDHYRSGDLMLTADPGFYIYERNRKHLMKKQELGTKMGVHGYDPLMEPDMHGIFYAKGPNVQNGVVLPPFQNIHIYPFIAQILGLEVPSIDGEAEVLNPILKK
ncbi:MAG: ectonucleotide pyrophosphatase/phosphodiesterase [Cyclobacteriaceae bacterium]